MMAQTAACVQDTTQSQSEQQLQPQSKWIGARELRYMDPIEDPRGHFVYTQVPGPTRRSPDIEVAELQHIWRFNIFARMDVKCLLKERDYGAFLVFKLKDDSMGLDQANALIRLLKDKGDGVDDNESGTPVFIAKKRTNPCESGQFPHVRPDGWMEIQLGQNFYIEADDDGVIHMQLKSTTRVRKIGLLVRGIEVRPT